MVWTRRRQPGSGAPNDELAEEIREIHSAHLLIKGTKKVINLRPVIESVHADLVQVEDPRTRTIPLAATEAETTSCVA